MSSNKKSLHNSHFDLLRKSRFCLTRQEELDIHLNWPELIIDPYRRVHILSLKRHHPASSRYLHYIYTPRVRSVPQVILRIRFKAAFDFTRENAFGKPRCTRRCRNFSTGTKKAAWWQQQRQWLASFLRLGGDRRHEKRTNKLNSPGWGGGFFV